MGSQSGDAGKTGGDNPTRLSFEKRIRECNSENDIYRLCNQMAQAFGFEYFLILNIPTRRDKKLAQLSLISSWPKKLMIQYDEYGLLENSPIAARLRSSSEPFVWSVAALASERPKDEQHRMLEAFEPHNIHHGVNFPTHLPDGSVASVSFCGAHPLEDEAQFLTLNYLASLIYDRLAQIRQETHGPREALTELELDILGMTADGIPPKEICERLAFSEQVLNLRFAQILHKMGAKNRMHAIKLAMKFKLI